MVRLLVLALLLSSCSSENLVEKLPKNLRDFMQLPAELDLHDNSCAVLATTQTNRVLDIIDVNRVIEQFEWDVTGAAINFDQRRGTLPMDFWTYYAEKGFDVEVRTALSCKDYEIVRQQISQGCSAQVLMFPTVPYFIGGHIEAILDIYVHKALEFLPEKNGDSGSCTMVTNSWGEFGVISGFSGSQYHHNKFPYLADFTEVLFTTVCPAQVADTCGEITFIE